MNQTIIWKFLIRLLNSLWCSWVINFKFVIWWLHRRIISAYILGSLINRLIVKSLRSMNRIFIRSSLSWLRMSLFSLKRSIKALKNCCHFLSVYLLLLKLLILFIIYYILFHSIFELVLILISFDVAISHYSRYLVVVVQYW
jgi:hypothetical protein